MCNCIDPPRLNTFAGTEGTTFTVRTADDTELVLSEIRTKNTRDDLEQYTLIFRGRAEEPLERTRHRFD